MSSILRSAANDQSAKLQNHGEGPYQGNKPQQLMPSGYAYLEDLVNCNIFLVSSPSSGLHIYIHLECGGHRAGTRPLPPLYPRLSIRRIIQISNQKTRYNSLWNGNLRRNSCRNSSSFDTKCRDNLFCTKYVVQFSVQAIVFQFRNIYYKRQIYDKFFKFYPAINILRMPIFLNIEKYFHSRIYTKAMQYWLENICEVYDFGKLRVSCGLQAGSRSSEAILLLHNPELHEHI